MENTLNGKISTESMFISVNNIVIRILKNSILCIYTIWDRLSLKTISRYCLLKDPQFLNRQMFLPVPRRTVYISLLGTKGARATIWEQKDFCFAWLFIIESAVPSLLK